MMEIMTIWMIMTIGVQTVAIMVECWMMVAMVVVGAMMIAMVETPTTTIKNNADYNDCETHCDRDHDER